MTRIAPLAPGVLILFAFRPALAAALAILTVSGVFDCYQVAANATFVQATPPPSEVRRSGSSRAE